MKTINPYLKQYQKNQIETATPEQVLILLYDGAIQFLNKARLAIEEGDASLCSSSLFSCQKIILEFMNTLDMERGGSLAENLYNLYEYLFQTLIDLNISKNLAKADEILVLLKGLRETWQKAIAIANTEKEKEKNEESMNNYAEQKNEDEDEVEDEYEDEDDSAEDSE